MGATCYANASLIFAYTAAPLVAKAASHVEVCNEALSRCWDCCLAFHFGAQCSFRDGAKDPAFIRKVLKHIDSTRSDAHRLGVALFTTPSDPPEFLTGLLDLVHPDLRRTFQGRSAYATSPCASCGKASPPAWNPVGDGLFLAARCVGAASSLLDAVSPHTTTIEDRTCPSCQQVGDFAQRSVLVTPPEALWVVVDRNGYGGRANTRIEIPAMLRVGELLALTPAAIAAGTSYLAGQGAAGQGAAPTPAAGSASVGATAADCVARGLEYRIAGITGHIGGVCDGHHNVSIPSSADLSATWRMFNDAIESTVASPVGTESSAVHMLMFVPVNPGLAAAVAAAVTDATPVADVPFEAVPQPPQQGALRASARARAAEGAAAGSVITAAAISQRLSLRASLRGGPAYGSGGFSLF
jgi:hypothetical protein